MNEDSSTFKSGLYHVQTAAGIQIISDREDELKILKYNIRFPAKKYWICINFSRKRQTGPPYSIRDGINIMRYS